MKLYRLDSKEMTADLWEWFIAMTYDMSLVEVTPDDEIMWCFRHSEETKGPQGVECYKHGYKGECDAALGYIYRVAK